MKMFEKIKEWIPAIIFISGLAFYVSAIWGLPPRVDKLEVAVQEQRLKSAQSDSTLETVATDVRDIKNFLYNLRK